MFRFLIVLLHISVFQCSEVMKFQFLTIKAFLQVYKHSFKYKKKKWLKYMYVLVKLLNRFFRVFNRKHGKLWIYILLVEEKNWEKNQTSLKGSLMAFNIVVRKSGPWLFYSQNLGFGEKLYYTLRRFWYIYLNITISDNCYHWKNILYIEFQRKIFFFLTIIHCKK